MKLGIFSIYDTAVKAFMQPFFAPTKGAAIRSFSDAVNAEGSSFGRHAADYALFLLGEYDDSAGSFVSLPAPERVMLAVEVESSRPPLAPPG